MTVECLLAKRHRASSVSSHWRTLSERHWCMECSSQDKLSKTKALKHRKVLVGGECQTRENVSFALTTAAQVDCTLNHWVEASASHVSQDVPGCKSQLWLIDKAKAQLASLVQTVHYLQSHNVPPCLDVLGRCEQLCMKELGCWL